MVIKIPKPLLYTSAIASAFGAACLMKEYLGGERYRNDVKANGKVVVITGANTGIGKEAAWELARRGAKVYMACRDMNKCEKAREEIVLDTKNKYVYCRHCDLSSLKSIRNFVSIFNREEQLLNILINNAGVMRIPKYTKTEDGFEMQLGTNHLGHFLLTNLLIEKLKEGKPSRIINVSSVAHIRGKINKEDLNSEKKYDPADAYAQSKLANVIFTKELAKRLEGTGVTANAVHPGIVDTEIIRHMSFFNSWMAKILIKPFVWCFIKSPAQGAQTVIYAALEPSLENVTGKYFSNCKEEEVSNTYANDEITGKWLWLVSEKWTRLVI